MYVDDLAVIGSRTFDNYEFLIRTLDEFKIRRIVSGGAKGVDSLAAKYADYRGIEITEFLPDYDKHGKSAPFIRNYQIIDNCELVVAFWNGKSNGTKHSINYAMKTLKPIMIIPFKEI